MTGPDRIAADFRARYNQLREDLDCFDADFRAHDFDGYALDHIREWCWKWWEARLMGRELDRGERRYRGQQGRN